MNTNDNSGRPLRDVPSGLDHDPNADEEIINQQQDKAATDLELADSENAPIAPANLSENIAYALDGSGPGPTDAKPQVGEAKHVTEGITGAGLEDEEKNLS
ncbi:hypothetical protein [Spirosoma rhododendri]|uniref:Uncharacterized protein n=1 Tax=Spirosoma rhododendri TaxID=2728024 RepID=A0A7L5DPG4_9BACT|nr:hypothetical protein [Spirosoma rhododendri]QJD79093.1 hypothetical protein HH216_12185 [Spirosoma rhododendri]